MRVITAVALAWLSLAAPAGAGFAVRPTVLHLTDQRGVATLLVSNGTATANVYQVGVAEWTDRTDPRKVAPTSDLIVSPQVFRLPPGEVARVRIRAAHPGVAGSGKAYRVLARQVMPDPGGAALSVRVQVQFTVPLLTRAER
jgi:fimbrial chaperone protein